MRNTSPSSRGILAIARCLGLETIPLDEEGIGHIQVEDHPDIAIGHRTDEGVIALSATLAAPIPDNIADDTMRLMLTENADCVELGPTIAISEEENAIILFQLIPTQNKEDDAVGEIFTNFLSIAGVWSRFFSGREDFSTIPTTAETPLAINRNKLV